MTNLSETPKFQTFINESFGQIRATIIDDETWFVGKDIAISLGYLNPNEAIGDHVATEDKLNSKTLSSFNLDLGQRGGWLVNESGLYSLILSSKLDSAVNFKRWVTKEVLPSIRKNGGYFSGQENLSNEELIARALIVAQNVIDEKEKKIQAQKQQLIEQKPKVDLFDKLAGTDNLYSMKQVKELLQLPYGRNTLFAILRDRGCLNSNNEPYQRFSKYFVYKLIYNEHLNKNIGYTLVTNEGLQYIDKLLKSND